MKIRYALRPKKAGTDVARGMARALEDRVLSRLA